MNSMSLKFKRLIKHFFKLCSLPGLYEENHGIVQNRMVDSKLKTNFTMPNLEEEWWNDMNVHPIWVGQTVSLNLIVV